MTPDAPHPAAPTPPAAAGAEAAAATTNPPAAPVPANQLTPEEQMALFEKELKETDWGHQPC